MTLYKFRNWTNEYHKAVLKKNELYLAPPSSFNDPFDCKIFAQFTNLSKEDLENYTKNLLAKSGINPSHKEYIINKISEDPAKHQKEFEIISSKNNDDFLGVLSLCKHWDNILMWSHYGDMHSGYCIGLDKSKLNAHYKFSGSGFVNYPSDKNYPKIHPIEDGNVDSFTKTVYHKSINWNYEKEYRLTKIKCPEGFTNTDRIITFPDNCIKEVIIGLKADFQVEKEIIDICKKKKITVFKAEKVPFKFEIIRKEIKY